MLEAPGNLVIPLRSLPGHFEEGYWQFSSLIPVCERLVAVIRALALKNLGENIGLRDSFS